MALRNEPGRNAVLVTNGVFTHCTMSYVHVHAHGYRYMCRSEEHFEGFVKTSMHMCLQPDV